MNTTKRTRGRPRIWPVETIKKTGYRYMNLRLPVECPECEFAKAEAERLCMTGQQYLRYILRARMPSEQG